MKQLKPNYHPYQIDFSEQSEEFIRKFRNHLLAKKTQAITKKYYIGEQKGVFYFQFETSTQAEIMHQFLLIAFQKLEAETEIL